VNPGIIYAQVKGFGEGSPYEKNLAFDMIAQACGGTMSINRRAGRAADQAGPVARRHRHRPMTMAISILGAPLRAPRDGAGKAPPGRDAGCDAGITSGSPFQAQAASGQAARAQRLRAAQTAVAPAGIFPCAPGGPNDWVYVFARQVDHWHRLPEGCWAARI